MKDSYNGYSKEQLALVNAQADQFETEAESESPQFCLMCQQTPEEGVTYHRHHEDPINPFNFIYLCTSCFVELRSRYENLPRWYWYCNQIASGVKPEAYDFQDNPEEAIQARLDDIENLSTDDREAQKDEALNQSLSWWEQLPTEEPTL